MLNKFPPQWGIVCSVAALLVISPTVEVAKAQSVKDVQLQETEEGFHLRLQTQGEADISTSQQGNVFIADLNNAQVDLEGESEVTHDNPFPGVESLTIAQTDGNRVQVTVTGTNDAPEATLQSVADGEVILGLTVGEQESSQGSQSQQPPQSQQAQVPSFPESESPSSSETQPEVMFPDPDIEINGEPAHNGEQKEPSSGLEPTRPQATAPPVGDIAVSTIDSSPDPINLGTNQRVSRLVLREAPVREVLSLLARSADLNLVFADKVGEEAEQTISVDLENESVQRAFNSVLQLSSLQANRRGNTIFVGANLPQEARNTITRTVRLNEVGSSAAASFLATQGAATQQVFTPTEQVVDPETQRIIREVEQPSEIISVQVAEDQREESTLLLDGLSVSTDERLNSITLIGEPRKVEIATDFLQQLDARRRQVAINVKIIDVDLTDTEDFNTSFSFGIGDTFFQNQGGVATIDFDETTPTPTNLLASLEAEIRSNNAKILTDPTLVVQEGQQASVNLTSEVFGGVEIEEEEDGRLSEEPIIKDAGLIVTVNVSRVDDNGFVSLNVNPTVSSPSETIDTGTAGQGSITLLQERNLTSGEIRLRDGQTLVLAGIIQDQDRVSVSKVPILGDIPLLGSLFRSTTRDQERQEVIVLLTPQIMDDSLESGGASVNYEPGPGAREMLEQQGYPTPQRGR